MATKKKTKVLNFDGRIDATPERLQHNAIATEVTGQGKSLSVTRRIVPAIDMLVKQDIITQKEWEMLDYYRSQALRADRSPAKCVLDRSVGGNDGGEPGVELMSAMLETGRIERDLGELRDIARAVAVDDITLARWCIHKHGGRERYDGQGDFVAVVPICEKRHMKLARLELKHAAGRIVK
jgi:hypothetical protein